MKINKNLSGAFIRRIGQINTRKVRFTISPDLITERSCRCTAMGDQEEKKREKERERERVASVYNEALTS